MKHMKKRSERAAAMAVAAVLAISAVPAVPLEAAAENTSKEEVAYINLNADGSVKEIYVVNMFDLDKDGQIIDYGTYESLRNMTTTDAVGYTGDTVTIEAKEGKLYYEGKLKENEIPWNIEIQYYMDGEKYSAEEIAAKSGKLKIAVSITENKAYKGNFFDGYALQAVLTLDTDRCRNIVAEGATIANVGSEKQISYTILPGKGEKMEITADVTDFEMDGIAINGIPLNLDIEVEDEELMAQVTELSDAIGQLDDGAGELDNGVSELSDGTGELKSGIGELAGGAGELYSGTASLKEGGSSLQSGAFSLQTGAAGLEAGSQALNSGVVQSQSALNTLNKQSASLTGGSAEFKAALKNIQKALSGVSVTAEDIAALTTASSAIKSGIDELVSGITALQQNVSFEGYKGAMLKNGLNIDDLKQSNETAIAGLQEMIRDLNNQIVAMQASGVDTAALEKQMGQLLDIAALLGANNASIGGTETYLTTLNQNIGELLQGAKNLQASYTAFHKEIGNLADILTGLIGKMSSLSTAVNTMVTEYEKLDSGIQDYTDAVAEIVAGYRQISDGTAQLVTGSGELKNGTADLYSGTGELISGIAELYNGAGTLKDGTGELDEGVGRLQAGIAQLSDGTGELTEGTAALQEETSGMDDEINDKIDELLESVTGGNMQMESFVSEKNTNVEAVQFVIRTEAISKAETTNTEAEETEETTNFWQKLLGLFGL